MAVQCTHCGEELLGAVNRCWRCGQGFIPQAGANLAPPVRQISQTEPFPPIMAELATPTAADPSEAADPRENGIEKGMATAIQTQTSAFDILGAAASPNPSPTPVKRRGSPFAEGEVLLAPADAHHANHGNMRANFASYVPEAPEAWQPRHPAAIGGAIASIVLGLIGLAIGWYSSWILILCVVGVGMGAWGVYSGKRTLAMIGIALCCLALLIGGFFAVARWYAQVYGSNPFDSIERPVEFLEN
jgi:hypothetical protein